MGYREKRCVFFFLARFENKERRRQLCYLDF